MKIHNILVNKFQRYNQSRQDKSKKTSVPFKASSKLNENEQNGSKTRSRQDIWRNHQFFQQNVNERGSNKIKKGCKVKGRREL